jgi:hypothetical protein
MCQHIVVVYDYPNYRFYWNGNLLTFPGGQGLTAYPYSGSWRWGYSTTNADANYFKVKWTPYGFTSFKIDDVRIYRRVLSAAEISWLYAPCGVGDAQFYEDTYTCASVSCNAGYTSADGVTCSGCAAGKYKTTTGSAACTDCPIGTWSSVVAHRQICVGCWAGRYGNVVGISDIYNCPVCPAGKYNTIQGATSINAYLNCAAGTYSTTEAAFAASTCITCPGGQTSAQGATACSVPECSVGF